MTLIGMSVKLLRSIYRRGLLYRRAGVYITETVPLEGVQPGLFVPPEEREKRRRLNVLVDRLNSNPMYFDKLRIASCSLDRPRFSSGPKQVYSDSGNIPDQKQLPILYPFIEIPNHRPF